MASARRRRGRKLRRDLRPQPRAGHTARHGSRTQQALVERRLDVLAALSVVKPAERAAVSRAAIAQALGFSATAALLWWLVHNTETNLAQHGLSLGFGFLKQPANFDIGDTSGIPYDPDDSFGRAILVGLANTARAASIGCVVSIVLGFILGVL